jgi:hypothetical protein
MTTEINKKWKVIRTIELNSSSEKVWAMVGGFYTLHLWHPDIQKTEIGLDQTSIPEIRRVLTFPGQPTTTEELVYLGNENRYYTYKWHSGPWGETFKEYHAEIRVVEIEIGKRCLVQWTGHFINEEDGLTQFYENGFSGLVKMFN